MFRRRRRFHRLQRAGLSTRITRPFGVRKTVPLRYNELNVALDPGAVTDYAVVFAANGLWDPNISGIGHQPIGFDQLMAMWFKYTVVSAKITVVFHNTDTINAGIVGIAIRDQPATETNMNSYIENGARYKNVGSLNSNAGHGTVTHFVNIRKFKGIGKGTSIITNDNLAGDETSNPLDLVFFHIFYGSYSGDDAEILRCDVTIDFLVIFHDPHPLVES